MSRTEVCTQCNHAFTGPLYWYSIIERYMYDDNIIPRFCSESCIQTWCLFRIPDFLSWLEAREIGVVAS